MASSSEEAKKPAVAARRPHFIPVPKHQILDQVLADTSDRTKKDELRSLCTMVDNLYSVQAQKTLEGMKSDYFRLSARSKAGRAGSTDPEAEERFFKRVMDTIRRANFVPISKAEADSAAEIEYLFSLPVEIAYSHLQSIAKYKRLLTDASLFPSMAHGAEIPDFSDHFFIFHRGVSVDRRTNHFIWNKIDLLLSIIGVNISKLFRGPSAPDSKAESKDGKVTISSRTSSLNSASSAMQKGDLIERINLVDTFNRRSSWFSWLTTEVTVQEPSYERLILVYRESGENDKDGTALSSSAAPPSPTKRPAQAVGVHDFKQEKPALGPVRIKLFRDVPMADMELVYPEKSVKMNPADKLRLWISIGLAIGAVVWQFLSPGEAGFSFMAIVTSIVLYAVRCYLSFQAQLDVYASVVNESLYQKSLDTDQGVLIVLTDTVEEQEFSELLLAYYFLWVSGPMTARQLKRACQDFLKKHWDVEVSFEVHDALRKLEELKLTEVDIAVDVPEDSKKPVSDDEDFDVHAPEDSQSTFIYAVLEPQKAIPILHEAWMAAAKQE